MIPGPAFGLMLGSGLVLIASPWLWPFTAPARPQRDYTRRMRALLVQSGLGRVSPVAVLGVSAAFGVMSGLVARAFVSIPVLDVAIGATASAAPLLLIAARARARQRALRTVWPDAVDHLIAGLRSGLPLVAAVSALGVGGPQPLRPAFVEFAADVERTGQPAVAFDDLKQALADPVADRVIETLRLAREVGGSELPAVLRALASDLRADAAIRSEVEARQAWVVIAARLGVAAPWVVLMMLAARPEAATAYGSPLGGVVLGGGFVVSVAAYRLMIALGRLPTEARWFG